MIKVNFHLVNTEIHHRKSIGLIGKLLVVRTVGEGIDIEYYERTTDSERGKAKEKKRKKKRKKERKKEKEKRRATERNR